MESDGWKIGRKLNYSEFKHINLSGPSEQVIKMGEKKELCEQWRAFEPVRKMLKTQLTPEI